MLTITDCIGLSGLGAAEIAAIAEHEHVPEIIACEIASCLVQAPGGLRRLEAMLADGVRRARARGDAARAVRLQGVLEHFRELHSDGTGR